jgi:soluble lytic murein transglycosylase
LDTGDQVAKVVIHRRGRPNATSFVGARGLMQVMPRTGEMTARHLGMNNFNSSQLTRAEYNVPIGSKYLRMMYDDFNSNMILATAAYNAGPHRVRGGCDPGGL